MTKINLLDLKTDWINILTNLSSELNNTKCQVVACSFNPRWTCAIFAIEKSAPENPGIFPNFDKYNFGSYEFDEHVPPLDIIYSVSEGEEKYGLILNGSMIPWDKGDYAFIKPVISYTAIWTKEFLVERHQDVAVLYFKDSDGLFPMILPTRGSLAPSPYWDPYFYIAGGDDSEYFRKIFG